MNNMHELIFEKNHKVTQLSGQKYFQKYKIHFLSIYSAE